MTAKDKTSPVQISAGWPGCALTIAIVAVRAFQPGSVPMEEWSWWSWALMMIPAALPFYLWGFFYVLRAAAIVLEMAFSLVLNRRKP